jgi:hypothetical protein
MIEKIKSKFAKYELNNLNVIKSQEISELISNIEKWEEYDLPDVEEKCVIFSNNKSDYLDNLGVCPLCGRS